MDEEERQKLISLQKKIWEIEDEIQKMNKDNEICKKCEFYVPASGYNSSWYPAYCSNDGSGHCIFKGIPESRFVIKEGIPFTCKECPKFVEYLSEGEFKGCNDWTNCWYSERNIIASTPES